MADLLSRAQAALASRFRVERELGRGGMATVFLAEDLKHNRLLAVKILHPDLAAAIGPERFRDEIDFAAHLNHPHILPLIDSGENAGLLWYAMPYVEGETLRTRLAREGRLPLADVADLTEQVAAAMDYAHGLGILHRDIKPENLLLAHGHVWVADFGIAKALKGAEPSGAGFEAGTPGYMSPEQMAGEPLDRRADLFSLGAVVFEMLTGQHPFPDFERKRDLFGRRRKPGRIHLARPEVPPRLETAVRKALAVVPEERQATAGEFAQAVTRAVTDPKVEKAVRRGWLRGGLVTFTLFAALAAVLWVVTRPPDYDDYRVVVLPAEGPPALVQAWGTDLAVALEFDLNSTRTLVATALAADTAAPVGANLPDTAVARLARSRRIRFSMQPRASDDGTVEVVLWDHAEGLRESRSFGAPAPGQVFERSAEIATYFLQKLIPVNGRIDRSVLGQRNVEALAAFLQGERSYRSGQFALADSLFRTAVALDPGFTWAALRGAQAASWIPEHERALELIQIALPAADSLGPRYAAFARGLEDYQRGFADSAVTHLREALRFDPLWAEAHMALAEVYHHYLPGEGALLDSARVHFSLAREYDATFVPPLIHLVHIAVWRDDRVAADSLLDLLHRTMVEEDDRVMAELMAGCLREGAADSRWRGEMARSLAATAQAAVWSAVGGLRHATCAADGLRAIPTDAGVAGAYAAYGPVVLAHVLAATGDSAGVRRALSSSTAVTPFLLAYTSLAIAAAGLPIGRDLVDAAEAESRDRLGAAADTAVAGLQTRWLLGTWAIARGDTVGGSDWLDSLRALPATPGTGTAARKSGFIASLTARLALARGDTASALPILEGLRPDVKQDQLRWRPWLAFAHERMLRARIYEARGQAERALEIASSFDGPASYGLLLYLPESLRRRQALAEKLGKVDLSRSSKDRLASLQSDRLP